MAWSTPKTWVLDDDLDATSLNRYIRDNQDWLKDKVTVDKRNLNRYATYSTSSTTFVNVDSTNLVAECDSNGGDFLCTVMLTARIQTGHVLYVCLVLDGAANSHYLEYESDNLRGNMSFTYVFPNVSAGTHNVALRYKVSSNIGYLFRPQLTVREVL